MARRPLIGRSVGSLVPQVTRKAMEKFGFPAAAILTDWATIAGAEMAGYTAPERLRWPKDHGGEDGGPNREAATLVLRVEGPRALEVQHGIPQLMERINAHFGFQAITGIRILQAPLTRKPTSVGRSRPKVPERVAIPTEQVADDRLRDVLERLGGQVRQHPAIKVKPS